MPSLVCLIDESGSMQQEHGSGNQRFAPQNVHIIAATVPSADSFSKRLLTSFTPAKKRIVVRLVAVGLGLIVEHDQQWTWIDR